VSVGAAVSGCRVSGLWLPLPGVRGGLLSPPLPGIRGRGLQSQLQSRYRGARGLAALAAAEASGLGASGLASEKGKKKNRRTTDEE
jgi:hypothetical protein